MGEGSTTELRPAPCFSPQAPQGAFLLGCVAPTMAVLRHICRPCLSHQRRPSPGGWSGHAIRLMATRLTPAAQMHQLPAGLALALAALVLPLPALADWPDKRAVVLEQQEAQALARLSSTNRRRYFESRRQLERRGADQRLAELRQLEDCLERTRLSTGADNCLAWARQRREQQRQWGLSDLAALRQRYGLPALPVRASVLQSRPTWWTPQQWQPQSDGQSLDPFLPAYGWY